MKESCSVAVRISETSRRATKSHLGPGLVDELPELLLLRVDGLAHPQRGVLPVLDVRARRADPGLAVTAVEPKRLT